MIIQDKKYLESDVWSLGAVFLEYYTGLKPYHPFKQLA